MLNMPRKRFRVENFSIISVIFQYININKKYFYLYSENFIYEKKSYA